MFARFLFPFLALPLFAEEAAPAQSISHWQNPAGTVTVTCSDSKVETLIQDQKRELDHQCWLVNGQPVVWNTVPAIDREMHFIGFPLAAGDQSYWLDDRFLVFTTAAASSAAGQESVAVIDSQTREVLVSNYVASCSTAPDRKSWAAIAYRSAPRRESRTGKEMDTLYLIEPAAMARDLAKVVAYSSPSAHIPAVQLYSLAMTKPLWTPDGKNILLILCKPDGAMQAARIDVAARSIARLIPLSSLQASYEDRTAYDITAEIDARYQPALRAVREQLLLPGPAPLIEEIWPAIYNPTDSSPRRDGGPPEPEIYEDSAKFIAHFHQRKDPGFITANDASANLQWRAEHVIIINADLVSVSMSEGHIDVTGIYQRNHSGKSWDLIAEQGGKFRDRSLKDLPQEAQPAK
ncbi:hypothetical protein [Haloferula sp. BvORR071]|uniref:hypothetical protein n=1 Tax=Haloferula sp. BvORR071 TaxID=1396141 RepID=UPI0005527447|nr:hypothetical protein [Haloferula sp. BvORR071]